jgi:hypothetical protein
MVIPDLESVAFVGLRDPKRKGRVKSRLLLSLVIGQCIDRGMLVKSGVRNVPVKVKICLVSPPQSRAEGLTSHS